MDTAYLTGLASGPIIVAGTGVNLKPSNTRFEILLTSFNAGTYTFGSNGNSLRYFDNDGTILNGSNGTLTITAKTNS